MNWKNYTGKGTVVYKQSFTTVYPATAYNKKSYLNKAHIAIAGMKKEINENKTNVHFK